MYYLAAISNIDQNLYEAAEMDGANKWQQTLHITLPGIMPMVIVMATLSLGNVLNAGFDQIFNLYSPLTYSTGDIIDTYVYRQSLVNGQYSFGTAVGLFKSGIGLLLTVAAYKIAYRFAGYRIFRKGGGRNMRRTSVSRKIFVLVNTIFLVAVALLCLLPLCEPVCMSLSGKSAANSGIVTFWPVDFTLLAYEKTFQNNNFIRSILISFLRTGIGTVLSMCVITTAGYALSKDFKGRTPLMWFFVFTMLFSGGLIPSYLVNSTLGLKNNFLIYVLPGAFSCYNLILIMNFFRSIPQVIGGSGIN